jgi:aspartate/methionine/tyrosine aminotransferase
MELNKTNQDIEEYLKKNDEIIKQLQDENNRLIDKQYNLVLEKLKELDPFIQYIKRNGIYFSHPEIDHLSARGPIIGYNDNEYFVYSLEERKVKVVNRYSLSDKKDVHLYTFISEYDFGKIMLSLEYIKQIPKLYVEGLKSEVEQRKKWIEQYS